LNARQRARSLESDLERYEENIGSGGSKQNTISFNGKNQFVCTQKVDTKDMTKELNMINSSQQSFGGTQPKGQIG